MKSLSALIRGGGVTVLIIESKGHWNATINFIVMASFGVFYMIVFINGALFRLFYSNLGRQLKLKVMLSSIPTTKIPFYLRTAPSHTPEMWGGGVLICTEHMTWSMTTI